MTTATATAGMDVERVCKMLDEHLATSFDLVSQIKQAHWTVTGPNFIALHELFDRQADLVRGYVDEFAERSRALQHLPCGTVRAAAKDSRLAEFPSGKLEAEKVVRELLGRFEQYSGMLTESIRACEEAGDLTTQDLFIEVQREIDRHAWFLRAHVEY